MNGTSKTLNVSGGGGGGGGWGGEWRLLYSAIKVNVATAIP